MHYWLQLGSSGLRIDIEIAFSEQAALLDALHDCRRREACGEAQCALPGTPRIQRFDNAIQLNLEYPAGMEIDQASIHRCMKHVLV